MDGGRVLGVKDRWRFVYVSFVILGVSGLLPWNLFITAHQYFNYKLRNASDTSAAGTGSGRTYLQTSFESFFTVSGSITCLLGNIVNTILVSRYYNRTRMLTGHFLVIISLLPTIALTLIDTDSWQWVFFIITLILVNIANFGSSGFICGGSMGLAAKFPPEYMQATITGQAVAGVFTSLCSIVTKALSSGIGGHSASSEEWDGLTYFSIGLAFTIFSLLTYLSLSKSKFARSMTRHDLLSAADRRASIAAIRRQTMIDEEIQANNALSVGPPRSPIPARGSPRSPRSPVTFKETTRHAGRLSPNLSASSDTDPLLIDSDNETPASTYYNYPDVNDVEVLDERPHKPCMKSVFKKIWYNWTVIVLTFLTTLSCFPSITSLTVSTSGHPGWSDYFIPVGCFLVFNLGDMFGRMLTQWIRWPGRGSWLLVLFALLRVGFIPLFLFCNVQPRHFLAGEIVFDQDWHFVVFVAVLALSNGYICSLCSMYGSKEVEETETELAGSVLALAINGGIVTGSILSFGFVHLI